MGQTPTYSLPWPIATDPPDVPLDMQQLAEATDTALGGAVTGLDARLDALEAGGGALGKIGHVQLGANAAQIDFTGIPNTFGQLLLAVNARSTAAGGANFLGLRVNGDAGTQYFTHAVGGNNNAVQGSSEASAAQAAFAVVPAAAAPAGHFGGGMLFMPNYSTATTWKVWVALSFALGGFAAANLYQTFRGGTYIGSQAVVSALRVIAVDGSLVAGSTATLYGLRGA